MENSSITEAWIDHDGISFYTFTVKPDGPPKAVLVLVHGYGEHCRRYDDLAIHLSKQGIEVWGFDQRGWGRTGEKVNKMGITDGYDKVLTDVKFMCETAKTKDVPLFLYGHSMGGQIVLNYCGIHNSDKHVSGVISSAPAIEIGKSVSPPDFVVKLGKYAAKIAPNFPVKSGIKEEYLTQNQEELEKWRKCVYNISSSSLRAAADLFKMAELCASKYCQKIDIPVLIAHGKNDPICLSTGAEKVFGNLKPAINKKLLLLDCKYHELHYEPVIKDQLYTEYPNWILNSGQQPTS